MNSLTLLDLIHCRIALPHHGIASIENISDAQPDESSQRSYWQLQRGQHRWSLYALDEDLQPLALVPPTHRLALCFKHQPLALSCAKIEALHNPQITPLPAMMKKNGSLVTGLILVNGSVALHVDSDVLFERLVSHQTRGKHFPLQQELRAWNAQPGT